MHQPRLAGRRILVVDDDEDIRRSVELALRSEGAEIELAADGGAALHAVAAARPDAIVLDMMLPKASGLLVMEKLQEMGDPPAVVMITANRGNRHKEYAANLGVSAYLVKPVALQRLIETLAELLGGTGA